MRPRPAVSAGRPSAFGEATGCERRQVFDLPERLIEVTEHRGLVYACACCGKPTRAAFPEGVTGPAQYGGRLRAAAVYLHAQQLIPEDRTAEALADLTGADGLCAASVAEWTMIKVKMKNLRMSWTPDLGPLAKV